MAYTTIKKPSDYFNTVLYTGDGTSSRNITGVGFQPDWVWVKERTSTSSNRLCDIVRGATKGLFTNLDSAEQTNSNALLSFDSDGFTIGDNGQVNENSQTYASWNWLASNTTASNTDGSITSTVSANTTSGFSIVSYTGTGSNATVGHGLGTAPAMVIVKNRDATSTWITFHKSLPNTNAVFLNLDNPSTFGGTGYWNNTSPTSSVFSIGTDTANNVSGNNHIAYCFADVKGFSKFGSYNGNGSTDGTFVYTGFKPAFVIIKRYDASSTRDWFILDNKRDTENPVTKNLYTDLSNAEVDSERCDFLSNGFKLTTGSGGSNAVDGTFIYMAFAEEPLVGDNPATAR